MGDGGDSINAVLYPSPSALLVPLQKRDSFFYYCKEEVSHSDAGDGVNAVLSHLFELVLLGITHRAFPIGRQILKWRVGRNSAFNVTKLRVIDPFANRATVLL